jgi:hypothetical protein
LRCRRGVAEIAGSLSMLAITISLLAGGSAVAMVSIHAASELVTGANAARARQEGILLESLGTQTNSTGTYLWVFNYGWESPSVKAVYADGVPVSWSTPCDVLAPRTICPFVITARAGANVSIIAGGVVLDATV